MLEEQPIPAAGSPAIASTTTPADDQPFEGEELRAALRHPGLAIDVLLAQRSRWTATIVQNREWTRMTVLMLVWTLAFSLPYGLVLSVERVWQIATLFLGSVALCLPSLHVVSAYLGLRIHVAQSFAFATIIATVAAIFSFGFAPILWFLHATSEAPSSKGFLAGLSALMLVLAALAGAVHGMRCLSLAKGMEDSFGFSVVVCLWQLLLLFIGVRMSDALGLT